MSEILAITNARAGTSEQEAIHAAVQVLGDKHAVEVAATRSVADLRDALDAHRGVDTVAVLGGDGTLHAVVAALSTTDRLDTATLGLIPMGTGNDFARTVGVSRDPRKAAEQMLSGEPCRLDLILDETGRLVVNAIHVGLGADAAVAARPWKGLLGPVGYAVGALVSGFTQRGSAMRVNVDGTAVNRREKTIQIAAGNGRYVGGGAPLLPDADPSDGLIDVAISYANPAHRRLGYLLHLRRGEHTERDDVLALKGCEITIEGPAFRCSADGEIGETQTSARWTIQPGAITMLLPSRRA